MNSVTVATYAINVHMQNFDIAPNTVLLCPETEVVSLPITLSGTDWTLREGVKCKNQKSLVYFSKRYINIFAGNSNVLQ